MKDKIRGSLIGGAAGDALGYTIEFMGEYGIFSRYGKDGIQSYELDPYSGKAVISDDTQMTLFTAFAVIAERCCAGSGGRFDDLRSYLSLAYQDWYDTQELSFKEVRRSGIYSEKFIKYPDSMLPVMLKNIPELFYRRAPGITCLSALYHRRSDTDSSEEVKSFIASKINNSKGCGGVMRVAPIGMIKGRTIEEINIEGAEAAAVTHNHSLGYISAAVFSHIINRIIFPVGSMTLKEIVEEARDTAARLFADDENIEEMVNVIDKAIELSENSEPDLDNIHLLGEGWVGEEALAIALYCSLKYENDFSKALIASVNHKGDSDSTGAITGNIVGAICGYEAMEQKWKDNLELSDLIINIADMLC